MKPMNMDVYLEKRLHHVFEQFAISPMDGKEYASMKSFTLGSVLDDPYTSKCDVRNFAKLKVGEVVGK